jgi:hypothetical protein
MGYYDVSAFTPVSSYDGLIQDVMVVFWEYLIPHSVRHIEDVTAREAAIKLIAKSFYQPLFDAIESVGQRKLHMLIVIEHDIRIIPPTKRREGRLFVSLGDFKSRGDNDNLLWLDEHLPKDDEDGSNEDDNDVSVDKSQNLDIRAEEPMECIFTSIDFREVALESLRALDLSSKVMELGPMRDMSHSIQDPFIILENGSQRIIQEPFYSWPTARGQRGPFTFKSVPEVVSSQTNILLRSFPFYVQGGNVLIGDKYVLVGGDIVRMNVDSYNTGKKKKEKEEDDEEFTNPELIVAYKKKLMEIVPSISEDEVGRLVNQMSEKLGVTPDILKKEEEQKESNKKIFRDMRFLKILGERHFGNFPVYAIDGRKAREGRVRKNPEDLYHIDMFLTLAGKKGPKELILVGQLMRWRPGWIAGCGRWVPIKEKNRNPDLANLVKFLNKVVKQLQEMKTPTFHVERIPILYSNGDLFCYNNCLVETKKNAIEDASSENKGTIFLPQFENFRIDNLLSPRMRSMFQKADNGIERQLRALGLNVVFVDMNFRALSHSQVGLHCLTSVLARG